jgi:hypothetical protein
MFEVMCLFLVIALVLIVINGASGENFDKSIRQIGQALTGCGCFLVIIGGGMLLLLLLAVMAAG